MLSWQKLTKSANKLYFLFVSFKHREFSKQLNTTVLDNLKKIDFLIKVRHFTFTQVNILTKLNENINKGKNVVLGINDGTKIVQDLCKAKPTRSYRISGKLGEATNNYFKDGRVMEKSTFHFITRYHMDKLLSAMQATHQKKMFE